MAAFFQKTSWHTDLERRCDGAFAYTGREQYGPNFTKDNTYYGQTSYAGMSPTACRVLTYSQQFPASKKTRKNGGEFGRGFVNWGREQMFPSWPRSAMLPVVLGQG